MTGAFLNAMGILLGAIFGLALRAPLSARAQDFFRRALGAATVFFGLRLVWLGVNGTFWSCVKQIFIALLAVTLGNWIGKLLAPAKNFQPPRTVRRQLISAAQSGAPRKNSATASSPARFCFAPRRSDCSAR